MKNLEKHYITCVIIIIICKCMRVWHCRHDATNDVSCGHAHGAPSPHDDAKHATSRAAAPHGGYDGHAPGRHASPAPWDASHDAPPGSAPTARLHGYCSAPGLCAASAAASYTWTRGSHIQTTGTLVLTLPGPLLHAPLERSKQQ